jgi:excisionase family DNA binding protein
MMGRQVGQEEVLLTFKEAMGYLRVSRSTVYRFLESGCLTGHKVGRTWRFYHQDVYACIVKQGQAEAPGYHE